MNNLRYYVNVPVLGVYAMSACDGVLSDEMLYGMHVEILDDREEWCHIRTLYRYEGYVLKKHLIESDVEANGFVASLSADILRLPKYASNICLTLPKGSFVRVLASEESWTKVQLLDGQIGYTRHEHVIQFKDFVTDDEALLRNQIVEMAMEYLGTQYRWGGKSSWGIDCSGLTSIVYLLNGFIIYRDAEIREDFGMMPIELSEIKPADLIYFPGHVALYIGDDRYVHSTGASAGVVINSLNEKHHDFRKDLKEGITGVARIVGGVEI